MNKKQPDNLKNCTDNLHRQPDHLNQHQKGIRKRQNNIQDHQDNIKNHQKDLLIERFRRGLNHPLRAILFILIKLQNCLVDVVNPGTYCPSDLKELNEIKQRALQKRTDISDHLETLFVESLSMKPKLMVELGVRSGESNFALVRAASLCRAKMVSVDLDDCSGVSSYEHWSFVQKNDLEFAREFGGWCKRQKIIPKIDVLFIDTSHFFKHTVEEINSWFPFLSEKAKVFFHDTKLRTIYFRKDGSLGLAYSQRGVIRALECYFARKLNENRDFIDFRKGWLIKHYSNCNGLTILERVV